MTNIEDLLKSIENEIDSILPSLSSKHWITRIAGSGPEFLPVSMVDKINLPARDLVLRGGKRWRPLLMVLFCRLCGGNDNVISLSPLVELLHNGSLIIDDIEDSSDFRRGAPAIHVKYGTDMAINSGNFLYFLPTALLQESGFNDRIKLRLWEHYGLEMRRLHIGQGLDIQWHNERGFYPAKDEYFQMCRFKTGGLARFSAVFGAICAEASDELSLKCGEIAETIGVVFQIMDDVKNLTDGNPGKKRGDDIVENKKSLPVILFHEKNPELIIELESYMIKARELGIDAGNEYVEKSIKLLQEHDCLDAALSIARSMLDDSLYQLKSLFDDSPEKEHIMDMFRKFTK